MIPLWKMPKNVKVHGHALVVKWGKLWMEREWAFSVSVWHDAG